MGDHDDQRSRRLVTVYPPNWSIDDDVSDWRDAYRDIVDDDVITTTASRSTAKCAPSPKKKTTVIAIPSTRSSITVTTTTDTTKSVRKKIIQVSATNRFTPSVYSGHVGSGGSDSTKIMEMFRREWEDLTSLIEDVSVLKNGRHQPIVTGELARRVRAKRRLTYTGSAIDAVPTSTTSSSSPVSEISTTSEKTAVMTPLLRSSPFVTQNLTETETPKLPSPYTSVHPRSVKNGHNKKSVQEITELSPFLTHAIATTTDDSPSCKRWIEGTYDVTFVVNTDETDWQLKNSKTSESKSGASTSSAESKISWRGILRQCLVTQITTIINGAEVRVYRPSFKTDPLADPLPEWQDWQLPSSGWLTEFTELLDGARYLYTYDADYVYAQLRIPIRFEAHLQQWRLKTRDPCSELVQSINSQQDTLNIRYCDKLIVQDFMRMNGFDGEVAGNWHFSKAFKERRYHDAEVTGIAWLHLVLRICLSCWLGPVQVLVTKKLTDEEKSQRVAPSRGGGRGGGRGTRRGRGVFGTGGAGSSGRAGDRGGGGRGRSSSSVLDMLLKHRRPRQRGVQLYEQSENDKYDDLNDDVHATAVTMATVKIDQINETKDVTVKLEADTSTKQSKRDRSPSSSCVDNDTKSSKKRRLIDIPISVVESTSNFIPGYALKPPRNFQGVYSLECHVRWMQQ